MKTVAFVLDYVMHYHRDTLVELDRRLRAAGGRLVLLTADHAAGKTGRVPLREKVLRDEHKFRLVEIVVGSYMLRHQRGVARILRELRPDVVITTSHSGTFSEWQVMRMKRKAGFKMVAWQCGYDYNPGRLKDLVLKKFIPGFDHHLAYHSNAREFAVKYGASSSQVTVMHNTINEEKIVRTERAVARRVFEERVPNAAGKTVLLYVGAVLAEKRLERVIAALDTIKPANVVFVVIGDGPHLESLREMYSDRHDIAFLGRIVEGVGQFFDAADIFVLPGTGGLAINEAMAHALPIVSGYADGSADDLVKDGVNGFRLRTDDPEELAMRIQTLSSDGAMRDRFGAKSLEMITTHLSFREFIDRVVGAVAAL
ncbi:MAG: glycosyltransferase family 4 protein [Burkholderiales bacterium]|nr:glycosyltransferase family 4 protein [Burkholderiales bacterium]